MAQQFHEDEHVKLAQGKARLQTELVELKVRLAETSGGNIEE